MIDGLNDIAQQNLIGVSHQLVSVEAPPWLVLKERHRKSLLLAHPSILFNAPNFPYLIHPKLEWL